ncbi:MAG: DUF2220 family protein, partial [Prosthecobacter sp.]|nr:DUF2220 family protein [Prosthecobacter sp.]
RGYTVEWVERDSRQYGRNKFPQRIMIDTEEDFLWLAGRQKDFTAFSHAVGHLRQSFPELEPWIGTHVTKLTELANSIEALIEVLQYFKAHPRPRLFARELPLSVHTKFIEWHHGVLREWLDLVLPPSAINSSETHFERRFGLRYVQPHLLIRTLDDGVRKQLALPCEELSLPLDALADLPVSRLTVFIVENRVNALTLPVMPRSFVLGGVGHGVVLFQRVAWIHGCQVIYWGDIDAEGFEALSSLRAFAPHTQSLLMDFDTLRGLRDLSNSGTGVRTPKTLFLSESETQAYQECCHTNLRIEQERVPQHLVMSTLRAMDLSSRQ